MIELITETNPMHKAMNKSMAVAYINRTGNYSQDVRTSLCFYDEDKDFANMMLDERNLDISLDELLAVVEDKTKGRIRYYSKGIV